MSSLPVKIPVEKKLGFLARLLWRVRVKLFLKTALYLSLMIDFIQRKYDVNHMRKTLYAK